MTSNQNPGPEGTDILKGWKEIGAYLGTSAKNAHRWEDSDKLPVYRLGKGRGPKNPVLARKSALDAWLQGTLKGVTVKGERIVALGLEGLILWSYDLQATPREVTQDADWRFQLVDLHSRQDDRETSTPGVLATLRFLGNNGHPDTMFYFSPGGKLYWKLEADASLIDRNDAPFEPAWTFKHVVLTSTPSGHIIWAALANEAGWAGCVLRIDPQGQPNIHLANAGYVERLCHVIIGDKDCMIVCGENNAFDQSFAALLGITDEPCCSPPGGRPRYRFANPPPGFPQKYILFPRTELIAARQKPYGHAFTMRRYRDHVIVEVETGGDGGSFLYHFSQELEPKYVFPSGTHEFQHVDLELAGKIDHPWGACPELEEPLRLSIWQPSTGWLDRLIPWRDNPWKEK
jgi:hypothetical protein